MPLGEITGHYNGCNITRYDSTSEENTGNTLIHFPILSEQSYHHIVSYSFKSKYEQLNLERDDLFHCFM